MVVSSICRDTKTGPGRMTVSQLVSKFGANNREFAIQILLSSGYFYVDEGN